jgi:DNA/RNA-binding domain of Phe-tRNA-synthetase-like protein
MPELSILLFELKYIKKGDISEKSIQDALLKATEQLKHYGFVKEFSDKKITAWAIVFAGEKCVERVNVKIGR